MIDVHRVIYGHASRYEVCEIQRWHYVVGRFAVASMVPQSLAITYHFAGSPVEGLAPMLAYVAAGLLGYVVTSRLQVRWVRRRDRR